MTPYTNQNGSQRGVTVHRSFRLVVDTVIYFSYPTALFLLQSRPLIFLITLLLSTPTCLNWNITSLLDSYHHNRHCSY